MNYALIKTQEEDGQKPCRREQQVLLVCNELPALQLRIEPDSLPFLLGSDIRKLWRRQESLAAVFFDLSPGQIKYVWENALLFKSTPFQ